MKVEIINKKVVLLKENNTENLTAKDVAYIVIQKSPLELENLSWEFRSDKDIVLQAVSSNGAALAFTSAELKKDKEVVLSALCAQHRGKDAFQWIDSELKKDKQFFIELLKNENFKNETLLYYFDSSFQRDKELVTMSIMRFPVSIGFAKGGLKDDKDIATMVVEKEGRAYHYLGRVIKQDCEIWKKAIYTKNNSIAKDSSLLREAPLEFAKDTPLVMDIFHLYLENGWFSPEGSLGLYSMRIPKNKYTYYLNNGILKFLENKELNEAFMAVKEQSKYSTLDIKEYLSEDTDVFIKVGHMLEAKEISKNMMNAQLKKKTIKF